MNQNKIITRRLMFAILTAILGLIGIAFVAVFNWKLAVGIFFLKWSYNVKTSYLMMEKLHTLGFPLVEVMPYQLVTQWPSFILAGKKLYFPKTEALLSELTYFDFTIVHKTNGLFYVIDRGELATDEWFDSIEVALADYYIRKKSNDNNNTKI